MSIFRLDPQQEMDLRHGIHQLEKHLCDQLVLALVPALLSDHPEEIAMLRVLHHDVHDGRGFDDFVESNHVGMGRSEAVESKLAALKVLLARIEVLVVETLDSWRERECVCELGSGNDSKSRPDSP